MKTEVRRCQCCHKLYVLDKTDTRVLCKPCNEQWEREARWEESKEQWRPLENEMLAARGFIIEDDYDDEDDWIDDDDMPF